MRFWLKLGFISFGGPAGQIAIMHAELVERRRWISENRFLHALNYCMLLPGPEAQQLATYIGWLMHRTWGGIVAGALFVLPSLFILIALSWIYVRFGDVPLVAGIFYGIKPAVTALVLHAAHRIGTRALEEPLDVGHRGRRLRRDLRVRRAVPGDRAGGRADRALRRPRRAERVRRSAAATAARRQSYGPALIDDDTPTPAHARFSRRASRDVYCCSGWRCGLAAMALVALARLGGDADADGLVLHEGRAADLRRRLRGAALRLPGRGRALTSGSAARR